MDIGRAISFVFEDENWISKILLGALILLIPFFGPLAISGYVIATVRNVMAGQPRPLPEWSDLGRNFVDGLMVWLAGVIYALPAIILACPVGLVWLLPVLGGQNQDVQGMLTGLAGLLSAGGVCLLVLYALLLSLVTPALLLQYAAHGSLGACLRVGDVLRLLIRNIGQIILILLIIFGLSLAAGLVVSAVGGMIGWIPFIGWLIGAGLSLASLPISVWTMLVQGHLLGQVGRQDSELGAHLL